MPQISQIDSSYFSDPDTTEDEYSTEPETEVQNQHPTTQEGLHIKTEVENETVDVASIAPESEETRLINQLRQDHDELKSSLFALRQQLDNAKADLTQLRIYHARVWTDNRELRKTQSTLRDLPEANRKLRADKLILESSQKSLQRTVRKLEEENRRLLNQRVTTQLPTSAPPDVGCSKPSKSSKTKSAPTPGREPEPSQPLLQSEVSQNTPDDSFLVAGRSLRQRRKDKNPSPEPQPAAPQKWRCSKCRQSFLRPEQLKIHAKSHLGSARSRSLPYKTHTCPICSSTYTRTDNVTRHMNMVHNKVEIARARAGQPRYKRTSFKKALHARPASRPDNTQPPQTDNKDIIKSDVQDSPDLNDRNNDGDTISVVW